MYQLSPTVSILLVIFLSCQSVYGWAHPAIGIDEITNHSGKNYVEVYVKVHCYPSAESSSDEDDSYYSHYTDSHNLDDGETEYYGWHHYWNYGPGYYKCSFQMFGREVFGTHPTHGTAKSIHIIELTDPRYFWLNNLNSCDSKHEMTWNVGGGDFEIKGYYNLFGGPC